MPPTVPASVVILAVADDVSPVVGAAIIEADPYHSPLTPRGDLWIYRGGPTHVIHPEKSGSSSGGALDNGTGRCWNVTGESRHGGFLWEGGGK